MHFIQELILFIVSALLGSVISVVAIQLNTFFEKSGKVKIYTRFVNFPKTTDGWGSHTNRKSKDFFVPLWVLITNTSKSPKIFRDISLFVCDNNIQVAKMKSITNVMSTFYANNGSYSVIVDPQSLKQLDCFFILKKGDFSFDEIQLSFYDLNDKKHNYSLKRLSDPWDTRGKKTDEDWVLVTD